MQAGKEFTDLFYALMAFLEIGLKLQADMGAVLSFMFLVNMIGAIALLPALGAFLMKPKRAKKD